MKDHMLKHSGNLPTCQIGACKDLNNGKRREFKFGKNLKAHIKTKHDGVYHYNCQTVTILLIAKGISKPIELNAMMNSQIRNTCVKIVEKPLMASLF